MNYKKDFETDIVSTSGGDLEITFIGHGSLMFQYTGSVIHIDPYGQLADYSALPKADLLLVTHEHTDHMDMAAINQILTDHTTIVSPEICAGYLNNPTIMKNGGSHRYNELKIDAVPAYNIIHERSKGIPFHPKGVGNGYVITFSDKKIYIAGDTEDIPEMKNLNDIECAFLPMNLPYTMTPEMVVSAVKLFSPKILYPYHYGNTDISTLTRLMEEVHDTETRIRSMQ